MGDITRIEVKLYTYHDLDLVALYKTGQITFPAATRQILNSYARKEVYRLRLLDRNEKREAKYIDCSYRKFYHYHVDLDRDADRDAIRLLESITPGYRNNFIKSLLRQYLCGVFSPVYNVTGDAKLFNEMTRLFQGDREEVEVRQARKRKAGKKDTDIPKIGEAEVAEKPATGQRTLKEKIPVAPEEMETDSHDDFEDFLNRAIEQY